MSFAFKLGSVQYAGQANSFSLLEVLSTVNRYSGFLASSHRDRAAPRGDRRARVAAAHGPEHDGVANRSRAHAGRILRIAEGCGPPLLQEHSDPLANGDH